MLIDDRSMSSSFNPVSSDTRDPTNRQMQHGPVADAIARAGIGGIEHRLQLLPCLDWGPDADPSS